MLVQLIIFLGAVIFRPSKMKYFKLRIVLYMSSFWYQVLGIYIPSNDTSVLNDAKSSNVLDMKNTYNIDSAVDIQDKTVQYAEACRCNNGKCVEQDGKMVCTCPLEMGVFNNGQSVQCWPCKCGKESNCTFVVSFWSTQTNCICKEGYNIVNNYCKGPCTVNPCKNGGTCADENKTFKCICPPEYTGQLCEDKDACTNAPCKNSGTCEPMGKTFKCTCNEPYSGDTCKEDMNPCTINPCLNGGTCKMEGQFFKCDCRAPYSGKNCEKDPCASSPCQNGGFCKADEKSFRCMCKNTHYGEFCEKEVHLCDLLDPCNHDTECIENGTDFYCVCPPGLTGKTCSKSEWCLHTGGELCGNAKCAYNFHSNVSYCDCGSSLMFNMRSRKCEPSYCGDHGTYRKKDYMKTCDCEENYFEIDGICVEIPGTTVPITTVTPSKRNICETSNPCQNGGDCIIESDGYFCRCPEGLAGKHCTESGWCVHVGYEECGPKNPCVYDPERKISYCKCEQSLLFNMKTRRCEACYCGARGTCLSEDGMKTCKCDANFIERDGVCINVEVTTPYDTASSTNIVTTPSCDCGSKSIGCKVDSHGRQKCVCFPGFAQTGNTCTETCTRDSDCLNGGSCDRFDDDYFCACPDGFAGDRCQVNAACDTLKCDVMRAVCRRTRDGAVCECPPEKTYKWFTGVCEDICDSRKCVNGKCEITGKTFTCVCDEGFTGLRCEEKVSPKQGISVYMIGFALLSAAIFLSTIGTFCLVCVVKRTGKENPIE